ncbi:MAG TPA: AAA family ATPase [Caproicibacter sp.]|nr:AAA family ATPase [Caproicibacter sp.]
MADKYEVLEKLQSRRNVILTGAPGTGKSTMMNEVAQEFLVARQRIAAPAHVPGAAVTIPADLETPLMRRLPFLQALNKRVFRTTFHQNTKYRDLITGIVPKINADGYSVSEGILYRANEFAKRSDSAALVIIDEINRGPAIEAFGGSIAALEPDKRLAEDGSVLPTTQSFEIISPDDGSSIDYAFSPRLYILAAMNQADVSVAPLDVAFLRRWYLISLEPDYGVLYNYFGIAAGSVLPVTPTTPSDVYLAAILALSKINEKIAVGRGEEYRLGHGIFMSIPRPQTDDVAGALDFATQVWGTIITHVEELFFGNAVSAAYVINASDPRSPYTLDEATFAEDVRAILKRPPISVTNIYNTLLAAGDVNV